MFGQKASEEGEVSDVPEAQALPTTVCTPYFGSCQLVNIDSTRKRACSGKIDSYPQAPYGVHAGVEHLHGISMGTTRAVATRVMLLLSSSVPFSQADGNVHLGSPS